MVRNMFDFCAFASVMLMGFFVMLMGAVSFATPQPMPVENAVSWFLCGACLMRAAYVAASARFPSIAPRPTPRAWLEMGSVDDVQVRVEQYGNLSLHATQRPERSAQTIVGRPRLLRAVEASDPDSCA